MKTSDLYPLMFVRGGDIFHIARAYQNNQGAAECHVVREARREAASLRPIPHRAQEWTAQGQGYAGLSVISPIPESSGSHG